VKKHVKKTLITHTFHFQVIPKTLHSQKKGTKAVTGAVPFQKVHFCPF